MLRANRFDCIISMEILALTTLFSVLFAILFLLLFLRSRKNGGGCADQDALLPFAGDDNLSDAVRPGKSDFSNAVNADAKKK